jgi:histidyl-tRNA synthetase
VNIKQLGLPEGHPEKEGVRVDLASMVPEIKKRLASISGDEDATNGMNGLQV